MLVNKKEKLQYRKNQFIRFLKSRTGKAAAGVCAAAIVLIAGIYTWNKGSLTREGLALCRQGDYAEAQTVFKNAVIADNMDPDNYVHLGIACLGSSEYEDAKKQFQLALNLDEENQEAYRGMGIAAYKTGDYEGAIEYLNRALDYSGINIGKMEYDILWYRADAEKALEDYEAASVTYSALLELEGDTALIRCFRGTMYCCLGDKEKAMEDFDAAVKKKGNGYELFWNIYDSMDQAGWREEAVEYLKLTEQPGYVDSDTAGSGDEVRRYQGMIDYICGDYKKAIERLSGDTLKKDEKAQEYLALAYEMNGDSAKALSIYLEQVGADNADADDYNRIARYFIRCGQGEQAVIYLEQGISSFGKSDLQDLYYNMITAFESCGDYDGALDALKTYVSLYGEDDAAKHEQAFLKERVS
ncbi:MAG: tetratricopeptide repeat protein [Lachnospiraceae bacterium]|nr:tetratricopeptide repeat protein [Lachnospiraceae bacterium]